MEFMSIKWIISNENSFKKMRSPQVLSFNYGMNLVQIWLNVYGKYEESEIMKIS